MIAAVRSLVTLEPRLRNNSAASRGAASVSPRSIDFDLIESFAAFQGLEADWNDLFARSGRPTHAFQSYNFCWHWARHYLASQSGGMNGLEPSIVTARRDGALVLVLPLATRRSGLFAQTMWMGDPVGQYGDALVDDSGDREDLLSGAFDFLSRRLKTDLLWLRRVRADAHVTPALERRAAIAVDRQKAPFMTLSSANDFAAFEQRYSSKARKNRRRLARRLQEKGSFAFERHHGGDAARALALEAVALKSRWLADRGLVSSAVGDARLSRMFADLALGAERPVDCIVAALKSAGETAAVEVSFPCKGRLSMHMIAFNLEFEKSGAGVLLLEQSLRDGFNERFSIYDMLAPADPYKGDWCDGADDVVDWALPVSFKGQLYARVYLGGLRGRLKALLKMLPKNLRHRLGIGAPRAAAAAPLPSED